ncbi:retropepsin-like aspartic protease, partial [Providencia stuartii]|uniref:retropepsin-like aspartic protease n=1 Tax=Providencia stuartii TaxID=588 RepID=UPI002AA0B6BA
MQNKEPVLVKKSNKIISYLALLMITGCSNTIKNHDPILVNAFQDQYVDYILVPVTINGEKYTFLLDTGSSTSVIDQSLVNKLTSNLDAPPAFYQKYFNVVKTVSDNKKMADVNFVNPISFYIGKKYFNGGDFWAANDLSLLSQMVGENISGILGIDIFRRLNWEIDNKNKVLTLYDNPPNINNYEQCITYDDYTLGAPSFNAYFDDKTYVNVKLDTGSKVSYLSSEFLDYLK